SRRSAVRRRESTAMDTRCRRWRAIASSPPRTERASRHRDGKLTRATKAVDFYNRVELGALVIRRAVDPQLTYVRTAGYGRGRIHPRRLNTFIEVQVSLSLLLGEPAST